ncbi:MAG TPA: hypothetical protein VHO01_03100 [Jatrophihabitans sp.]|nr:hypothetical protein [Jatrophihabitans sp.]
MILLAADLDRTLIYSAKAVALGRSRSGHDFGPAELVPVEFRQGEQASFMTAAAAKLLAELPIVPVTTRSLKQYRRVRLPGPPAAFAIAGNGGHLLIDGEPDPAWAAEIRERLRTVSPLAEAVSQLQRRSRPDWRVHEVDGLFCYAVIDRAEFRRRNLAELDEWAQPNGWRSSLQGRKLYLVPRPLAKSAAVAELARRTGTIRVYAAGDSLLDIDLLQFADHGIHPGHGELARSGWSAAHVQRLAETGPLAGERIAEWLAAAS